MTTKQPDWEAIERAYRAGSLLVRVIAENNSLTKGAVHKRAKKEGWTRDLAHQAKTAARDKLVRSSVRTPSTQPRTDAEIVEEASDQAASVVLAHRVGLAQWCSIADKLSVALADIDVDEDNLGDFSRALNAGQPSVFKRSGVGQFQLLRVAGHTVAGVSGCCTGSG
jgi:hypothetical protein